MAKQDINKRLTRKVANCIKNEKYQLIAVWVTDNETEIFICPENPDKETSAKIVSLSQSFC